MKAGREQRKRRVWNRDDAGQSSKELSIERPESDRDNARAKNFQ